MHRQQKIKLHLSWNHKLILCNLLVSYTSFSLSDSLVSYERVKCRRNMCSLDLHQNSNIKVFNTVCGRVTWIQPGLLWPSLCPEAAAGNQETELIFHRWAKVTTKSPLNEQCGWKKWLKREKGDFTKDQHMTEVETNVFWSNWTPYQSWESGPQHNIRGSTQAYWLQVAWRGVVMKFHSESEYKVLPKDKTAGYICL